MNVKTDNTQLQIENCISKMLIESFVSKKKIDSDHDNIIHSDRFFKYQTFFDKWFKKEGIGYFFLFRKNSTVTNIQYAELLSLIQLYSTPKSNDTKEKYNPVFYKFEDFRLMIEGCLKSYVKDSKSIKELCNSLVKENFYLLYNSIVIDIRNNSALVFIPQHIELDLKSIIAYSGYIHSCGYHIFTRNVDKAKSDLFHQNLSEYLIDIMPNLPFYTAEPNRGELNKIVQFVPYCYEDFKSDNAPHINFLDNGLNSNKFHLEKYYMGTENLSKVFNDIPNYIYKEKKLSDCIQVAPAGSFKNSRFDFLYDKVYNISQNDAYTEEFKYEILINDKVSSKHTIFFIIDTEINQGTNPLDKYYICYDQVYLNHNPFHHFDENKPGWIDHTTIPHSLMGAMLNLTIPIANNRVPSSGKIPVIKIIDPFVGSGTTLFEALKYSDQKFKIDFKGSDGAELVDLVVSDNIAFFYLMDILNNPGVNSYFDILKGQQLTLDKMFNAEALESNMKEILKFLKVFSNIKPNKDIAFDDLDGSYLKDFYNENFPVKFNDDYKLDEKDFSNLIDRAFLYLVRRVFKRHNTYFVRLYATINRMVRENHGVLINELSPIFEMERSTLFAQIESHILAQKSHVFRAYGNKSNEIKNWDSVKNIEYNKDDSKTGLKIIQGDYSLAVSTMSSFFNERLKKLLNNDIGELDKYISRRFIDESSINLCGADKYDIVIADPPYGFNTDENLKELSIMYKKFLNLALEGIAKNGGGQLLLCLPEKSMNGKPVHYFTSIDFIKYQIRYLAESKNLKIVVPNSNLPFSHRPPYYWESPKALRRTIIHYVFELKH